jgi:hypothetical protein
LADGVWRPGHGLQRGHTRNAEIQQYLEQSQPDILLQFRTIVRSSSLEACGSGAAAWMTGRSNDLTGLLECLLAGVAVIRDENGMSGISLDAELADLIDAHPVLLSQSGAVSPPACLRARLAVPACGARRVNGS